MAEKAREVVDRLIKRKEHISFAESCTGGLAAAALVDIPDASRVFDASFVTYGAAYSPDGALKVSGAPDEIGSPTPAYGRVENLSANDTVALSMPATVVAGEGTVTNYLTGWKLESVNAETGARALLRSSSDQGESIDRYAYTHASYAEFTWFWDVRDALGVGTPAVVSKGQNSLTLSAAVAGIGYTAPSATLKFVYGASPDALAYTSVVSASVTGIGAVQGTLSRLTPGAVYYVKAVLETNDAAHDAVESAVEDGDADAGAVDALRGEEVAAHSQQLVGEGNAGIIAGGL